MSNRDFIPITPSDTVPITSVDIYGGAGVSMIYVGVSGDIAIVGIDDTTPVVFKAVRAGWMKLPMFTNQVMATGTTATNLIGVKLPSTYAVNGA
jgi:hypothetical protein